MRPILFGTALLMMAAPAVAQDMSPGTPTQGSPPTTNTPGAMTPDAATDTMSTPADPSGGATAPVTKPMAETNTNTTDTGTSDASTTSHKKKRPHG